MESQQLKIWAFSARPSAASCARCVPTEHTRQPQICPHHPGPRQTQPECCQKLFCCRVKLMNCDCLLLGQLFHSDPCLHVCTLTAISEGLWTTCSLVLCSQIYTSQTFRVAFRSGKDNHKTGSLIVIVRPGGP